MKVVGQSNIVRWVVKLVAKRPSTDSRTAARREIRTLDAEQLRHVGGGTGSTTDGPNKGW
jgi:hypothetical protein